MAEQIKNDNVFGSNKWINAHYDPLASVFTFSQCMVFADINADGDYKFIVSDFGFNDLAIPDNNININVYKGTSLFSQFNIHELPTTITSFYMDLLEPRIPVIAIGASSSIFLYKNLRPYFKFSLPPLSIDSEEDQAWKDYSSNNITLTNLCTILNNVQSRIICSRMLPKSVELLAIISPTEKEAFANINKNASQLPNTSITCMSCLKKSTEAVDAVSCVVFGTENCHISILDPETFTIVNTLALPSVPVFLSCNGITEVDYTILVSCRDGGIYGFKRGSKKPRELLKSNMPIVGMVRCDKCIIIACMDETLQCYNIRGKKQWEINLPCVATCLELFDYQPKNFQGVLVALSNGQVQLYSTNKVLLDRMINEDVIIAMKFGKFGRDSGTLCLITKSGGLIVRMLKRSFECDSPLSQLDSNAHKNKFQFPKKDKLYLDHAAREQIHAKSIYRQFQEDLCRLRLETSRRYSKALEKSLNTVSVDDDQQPVKLQVEVTGIGPQFKLNIIVENLSPVKLCTGFSITFDTNESIYSIEKTIIQLPLLVAGIRYSFQTLVQCLTENAISEVIKVFILRNQETVPILTGLLNMPTSEAVLVI